MTLDFKAMIGACAPYVSIVKQTGTRARKIKKGTCGSVGVVWFPQVGRGGAVFYFANPMTYGL